MNQSKVEKPLADTSINNFHDFVKNMNLMQNNTDFDLSDCKVFDTEQSARTAALNDACYKKIGDVYYIKSNGTLNAAVNDAWYATYSAAQHSNSFNTWEFLWWTISNGMLEALSPIFASSAESPAFDISLHIILHSYLANLPIAQEHRAHLNKRFSIWENGYGVECDVGGILYVYRALSGTSL